MKPYIINEDPKRVPRAFLVWWVGQIKKRLRKRGVSISADIIGLIFLPARRAKKLNREFRGKDYATDVLSFAPVEPGVLGELVFCPKVIEKEAKENGYPYYLQLGYLVLHGYLHLLGYEHEKGGKQAEEMFSLQDAVFDELCRSWSNRLGNQKRS